MSKFRIEFVVFLVGLVVVCWIGAGYLGTNPLASAVTLLIGACYLSGAFELRAYQRATAALARDVSGLSEPPSDLSAWLGQLHPSLRSAVRSRIEDQRVALPGPALTPYLVGLLVLLGMLGTLLGMVVTLRGTGAALESATDLQAIHGSLAAPLKGLGFAFGTSIAGVATSAMLGLLSALCRRERIQAGQLLDTKIATTLRVYSNAHQRDETLRLLQRQAEIMPTLVDRLQTMMSTIEQQSLVSNERQIASQQAFLDGSQAAYARLTASMGQSLQASAAESARAAGAALQPLLETTMAGLARETAALHDTVTHAVQRQLDGLSTGFEASTATVADIWKRALTEHTRSSEALTGQLHSSLDRFSETFEQRSAGLLEGVSARLEATVGKVSQAWNQALSRQEQTGEKLAADNQHALTEIVAAFGQQSDAQLRAMSESHAGLQTELASGDQARLASWTGTLASMAATLSEEWAETGAQTARRQHEIGDTLERTVRELSAQTEAHAKSTIAEIGQLVQAASEAPKAAAEIVAELRQKLSESLASDTAMLAERARLMETLETLLDAVTDASTRQRSSVDALIATSAELLERVGSRFGEKIEAETLKLDAVSAQVTGSAVEVASLGEAFGLASESFGQSNDKLVAHLQRIEAALDKSATRSDEQLAYYVAQAREVIDLSMLSQKQIIEELRQFAGAPASTVAAAS